MTLSLVYITANDEGQAREIGRALVEARLAACANILGGMNSIYWWDGEVEEAAEAILIVKTREALIPALVEKVRSMHSYECPCVVSLPILSGNPGYLNWIQGETTPAVVGVKRDS